jgi:hypothetical protein
MPTVLRVDGFKFSFYAGDHDPPHVHVRHGGTHVIIEIASGGVRRIGGMRDPDVKRALAIVKEHREALLVAWMIWDTERRKEQNGLA